MQQQDRETLRTGMHSGSSWRRRLLVVSVGLTLLAPGLTAVPDGIAAPCEGDECQGPPPAPEEVIPGTAIVEGPQNPPVRFPESRHHTKHRHHRQQRAARAYEAPK